MANICVVTTNISGDLAPLSTLTKLIRDQDTVLIDKHPMLIDTDVHGIVYGMCNLQCHASDITLAQACSRQPSLYDYLALSKDYPTLTIVVSYEECGNQVYGSFVVEGGSCIESVDYTEEQYLERHDEEYQAEKKRITESPYEEFLEEYTEWDVYTELKYAYLGKDIVARIKDTDLPLFINVEWEDEETERLYKNRYSTIKEAL
jgi:hypothetical protein